MRCVEKKKNLRVLPRESELTQEDSYIFFIDISKSAESQSLLSFDSLNCSLILVLPLCRCVFCYLKVYYFLLSELFHKYCLFLGAFPSDPMI